MSFNSQLKPTVMDKMARILDRRLAVCGNRLIREVRVSHDTEALADTLRDVIAKVDEAPKLIIVFGASAVIGGDVIPQAIRDAGGSVLRVDMPVDPGNLMVLGQIAECCVLGGPRMCTQPKGKWF
jgi:molybdenum cofactor cytidylyltransferase